MECLLLCLETDASQSPQALGVWDGPGSSQKSRDVHSCVVGMRANHLCLARVQANCPPGVRAAGRVFVPNLSPQSLNPLS